MEITGFDEQIGVVRRGVKAIQKADAFINKKTRFQITKPKPTKVVTTTKAVSPRRVVTTTKAVAPVKRGGVFTKLQPSQIRVAPRRAVTTTRAVAPVKRGGVFTKLQPSQIRVAPRRAVTTTRSVAPTKTVAVRRAELIKMIQAKRTANVVKPTSPSKIVKAKQFKKLQSAPVKVFSTDGSLRNVTPSALKQMNDVQRSFARVDLPFQAVTPPTKRMRVKNTPLDLPININMIEPAVDAGVSNYYGK